MATSDAHKKDMREKIELGALIVKAGLRYEKRALLLGASIETARRIKGNEPGCSSSHTKFCACGPTNRSSSPRETHRSDADVPSGSAART